MKIGKELRERRDTNGTSVAIGKHAVSLGLVRRIEIERCSTRVDVVN